eukprot:350482-Chlamydomonas_euryale.AAC.4
MGRDDVHRGRVVKRRHVELSGRPFAHLADKVAARVAKSFGQHIELDVVAAGELAQVGGQ